MTDSSATSQRAKGAESAAVVCKSYRRGQRMCADGFPVTHHCRGHGACHACGTYHSAPMCLRDDFKHIPWWLDDDGKPRAPTSPSEPVAPHQSADEKGE